MIQEIKVRNFLSFKDEVTLSFEATKDTFAKNYQTVEVAKGVHLLRFAMIYGANASGKSNLLEAFDFLCRFWFYKPHDIDEKTGVIPFKLDKISPNEPSYFELIFYVNGKKYWYQLELDEKQIYLEKLFFYKTVQPTLLFERELKEGLSVIAYNPTAVKISAIAKEKIAVECLKNMSFFAAREQVNVALPLIDDAKEWLKNNIMQIVQPQTQMFAFAENKMLTNAEIKDYLLEFVHIADFNIVDIMTRLEKEEMPKQFVDYLLENDNVPEQEKEKLRNSHFIDTPKTEFIHTVKNERGDEKYHLPESLQSDGTLRLFGIEAAIYEALSRNAALFIDEIETSLHPRLLRLILLNFLKRNSQSQLLITTHYDPLLNEIDELFRKDSIWFTEKTNTGHTEVYSLVDFKGLNRLSSIQKAYNYGKFGAIPKIDL